MDARWKDRADAVAEDAIRRAMQQVAVELAASKGVLLLERPDDLLLVLEARQTDTRSSFPTFAVMCPLPVKSSMNSIEAARQIDFAFRGLDLSATGKIDHVTALGPTCQSLKLPGCDTFTRIPVTSP